MSKIIKRIGCEWMLVSPANKLSINASDILTIHYNEVYVPGKPLIQIETTRHSLFIGKTESFSGVSIESILNDLRIFVDDDLYEYLYATLFLE